MGGGDLNLKKSWHPGTLKNQEIVWKKEQKLIEEKKKLAQLRKELQEERDREYFEGLSKKKNKSARLEWMYSSGPNTSQDIVAQQKEDYLLGRKRIDEANPNQLTKEQLQANYEKATNSIYGLHANTDKDFQSKVRDDPLLMFRKQEQAALEAMLKNPMVLKDVSKKSKKDKKERKSKKDKEEKRDRHRSRSPRDDGDRRERSREHNISRSPEREIRSSSPKEERRSRSRDRYRDRSISPYTSKRSSYRNERQRSRSPPRRNDQSTYRKSDREAEQFLSSLN